MVVDDKEVQGNFNKLKGGIKTAATQATFEAANMILTLSNPEVPLDLGPLSNSGRTEKLPAEIASTVSYNTTYAARLHEHPELNFQNGRKGKYLEEPIINNKMELLAGMRDSIRRQLFT